MTGDLRQQLREGDPLNHEPTLAPEDVQYMRHRVISATQIPRRYRFRSHLQWAAALALVCGVAAVVVIRNLTPSDMATIAPEKTERRQLQFETPGGTRIVWILDPQFQLPKERQ